jgi:hypothetical protein
MLKLRKSELTNPASTISTIPITTAAPELVVAVTGKTLGNIASSIVNEDV